MDLIRFSINRPVSISVGVLLVIMFGLIGLKSIPVQLTPTIDRPIITVNTLWPGRDPSEIVEEIAKEQEKRLKNVSNLRTLTTISREGQCQVTLEFYVGTDLTRGLQEVSDALRQVPDYPEEVDEPVIRTSEGAAETAIAWIIIDLDPAKAGDHPGFDIATLYNALDREVRPYIERIDGVAEVNIFGGREKQVRVLADPFALAQRGLSYNELVAALRTENQNISAGTIAEGKRDFRVRLVGQFQSERDVLDTIIAYRDGRPVYVRDVASVETGHEKVNGFVRSMGVPCIAMNVIRQAGSNVMEIMPQVREKVAEVQAEILPRIDPAVGKDLRIRQVYDETVYIQSAIDLVVENLWVASVLTILCLLVFLRSIRETLIIAVSIPISVIGTFLVMAAFGRTLNVVSLAGLAFATGVVVDNANVVLENIDRRRKTGEEPLLAVYRGTREVWVAILTGTLTTVAVFIPILTVREEVGQLFFDLSFALATSTLISLVVAITVVPSAAGLLARTQKPGTEKETLIGGLFGLARLAAGAGAAFSRGIRWIITGWRGAVLRPGVILVMIFGSLWGSLRLMPPMDYLPAGNQNLVFGGMLIPPGLSVAELNRYSDGIDATVNPYLAKNLSGPDALAKLPPIANIFGGPGAPPHAPVAVADFFVGAFEGSLFAGGVSADPNRVIPVGALLTNAMNGMPDAFGGAQQASIFSQGFSGGNDISLEISGPDHDRVLAAAGMVYGLAGTKYGFGSSVQANPANFNKLQPEWKLRLTDAGRELGLRTEDLGVTVRGLFDGAFAGEFRLTGRNVDLVVVPKDGRLAFKEQIATVPVMTPAGRLVPMSTVASIEPGLAPQEIKRIEELPSVSINVTPRTGETVEQVMRDLEESVVAPARAAGLIDPTMRVRMEGTAAKLDEVRRSLLGAAPSEQRGGALFTAGRVLAGCVGLAAIAAALMALVRGRRRGASGTLYGVVGAVVLGLVVAGVLLGVVHQPQLLMARFVWALLVTYLLMSALFESFLSPLVIMFSVPPAVVGGFAALRLVHEWTLRNPNIAPQQLDTMTMIGFVILIGTVVNNAILLVEQTLNFMDPSKYGSDDAPLPMADAVAASVRTRLRPIFMTSFTTLAGGLPLVVSPGAGSEMYRGLGAVVLGGLLVSTLFTLVLVPLGFSLMQDMVTGYRSALGRAAPVLLGRVSEQARSPAANGVAPS